MLEVLRALVRGAAILGLCAATWHPAAAQDTVRALAAASAFAAEFLAADANPRQVFFLRDPVFPAPGDQPVRDCDIKALVRWIEPQAPYFESGRRNVVVVPIVAELLMVEVGGFDWGYGRDKDGAGKSWCTWEYERLDASDGHFRRPGQFRTRTYSAEFATWGPGMESYRSPAMVSMNVAPGRVVVPDPDKRLVRYHLRVNVTGGTPHRLAPQVPRHWLAADGLRKLQAVQQEIADLLARGVSDRDPAAQGAELQADLARMRHQNQVMQWQVQQLKSLLDQPALRVPLSRTQPQAEPVQK